MTEYKENGHEEPLYCSDEELEELILQIEADEMIAAPPDLEASILERIGLTEEAEYTPEQTLPLREGGSVRRKPPETFRAFRIRVAVAAVAAAAAVFAIPFVGGRANSAGPLWEDAAGPETMVQEHHGMSAKSGILKRIGDSRYICDYLDAQHAGLYGPDKTKTEDDTFQ